MKEIRVIYRCAIIGSVRPLDNLYIPVDTFGRVLGPPRPEERAREMVISWWISTLTPKWLLSTAADKL